MQTYIDAVADFLKQWRSDSAHAMRTGEFGPIYAAAIEASSLLQSRPVVPDYRDPDKTREVSAGDAIRFYRAEWLGQPQPSVWGWWRYSESRRVHCEAPLNRLNNMVRIIRSDATLEPEVDGWNPAEAETILVSFMSAVSLVVSRLRGELGRGEGGAPLVLNPAVGDQEMAEMLDPFYEDEEPDPGPPPPQG